MIANTLLKFSIRSALKSPSHLRLCVRFKSILHNTTNFKQRTIDIVSCGKTFKEWRKLKKRYFTPKEPLRFSVEYIDTDIDLKTKSKHCVLALHGMPGSYSVYSHLLDFLPQHGIRVIAPNFPDNNYYPCSPSNKPGLFHQSAQEKEELLRDFLKAINVDKLDMIITHSSAIYPGIDLVLNQENLTVKSLVMFNIGSDLTCKAMNPLWMVHGCGYMSSARPTYKFLMKIGSWVMRVSPTNFKTDDVHGMAMLAMTMTYSEIFKFKEKIQEVGRRKFPMLYVLSENDFIVEKEMSYRNAKFLGCSEDEIYFVNKDGDCLQPPVKKNSWLKVMSFSHGSHYVFKKYAEKVNKEVLSLFHRIST